METAAAGTLGISAPYQISDTCDESREIGKPFLLCLWPLVSFLIGNLKKLYYHMSQGAAVAGTPVVACVRQCVSEGKVVAEVVQCRCVCGTVESK